jgi:hypothetical protein
MEGVVKKVKVADLRTRCHSLGLATSGNREALEQRLQEKGAKRDDTPTNYALPLDIVVLILSLTVERPPDLRRAFLSKPVFACLQNHGPVWARLFHKNRDALKEADGVLGTWEVRGSCRMVA